MEKLDTRQLQRRGAELARAHRRECSRLVLLYCGVIAAISLGSNGLHLLLDSRMGSTGGLGGLGLRSLLQTGQEILAFVNLFFGPFWSAGFLLAMIRLARGQGVELGDMTGGFRRFGRMLGFLAFEFLTVVVLLMATMNLAGLVFSFSPLGTKFAELMGPALNDPNLFTAEGAVNLELVPMEALEMAALPMAVMTAAIFLPVYIWVSYGFRMSLYLLMDRPVGGVRAHFESLRLMRGRKWQLFKLDLRFWWYHGLGLLILGVGYLDVILGLLGLPMPMDETVMFFLTLAVYCGLQLLLSLWKKCEVDGAYVLAYEQIANPEPVEIAE